MKHSKIVALSCLALVQASFVAPAQAAPGSRACGMYFQRTVPGRSPTEYQARVVFAEIRTAHAEHKDHCDAAVKKSRVRSLDGGGSNGTVARTFRMKTCEEVGAMAYGPGTNVDVCDVVKARCFGIIEWRWTVAPVGYTSPSNKFAPDWGIDCISTPGQ